MSQHESHSGNKYSKEEARKGCGDCFMQDCQWPECMPKSAGAPTQAPQQAASAVPDDPMDWKLPCDVTVGHGTVGKGVPLRTLVTRMKVLYEMATGKKADEVANRTPEQRAALFEAFRAQQAAPQQQAPAMPSEIALMEKAARRVGITSLLNHGAASCVYSGGCAGVSQEHLLAYTREIALHCAVALAAPQQAAPAQPDDFGSAEHWKEKAQYWAGVAHRLRGEALRGEPVDGIIQPPTTSPKAAQPAPSGDASHVQNPAGNEHVACDVSKKLSKLNMTIDWDAARKQGGA